MENDEKKLEQQNQAEGANEGSLSDADLEQVAGGRYYENSFGTRTSNGGAYFDFIFRRSG